MSIYLLIKDILQHIHFWQRYYDYSSIGNVFGFIWNFYNMSIFVSVVYRIGEVIQIIGSNLTLKNWRRF